MALDTEESLVIEDSDLERNLLTGEVKANLDLDIKICVDSGCSRHSFADRSLFITYEEIQSRSIKGIDNSEVKLIKRGIVQVECSVKGTRIEVTLSNILHVPEIGVNLLSVGKLLNTDIEVGFHKTECTLTKDDVMLIDTRHYSLFFLDLWETKAFAAYSVPSDLIH